MYISLSTLNHMATTLIPIAAYEVLCSLDALRVQKSPMLTAGYTEHGDT